MSSQPPRAAPLRDAADDAGAETRLQLSAEPTGWLAQQVGTVNAKWLSSRIWRVEGDRFARLVAELGLIVDRSELLYISAEVTDSDVDADCAYSLTMFTADLVVHATGNAEHLWSTIDVFPRSDLARLVVTTAPSDVSDDRAGSGSAGSGSLSIELVYPSRGIVIPGATSDDTIATTRAFIPALLADVKN